MKKSGKSIWHIAGVCILLLIISSGTAFGQIYVTSKFITVNESYPGEVYNGELSVMNVGEETEIIRLTQKDYLFYATGKDMYPEAGYVDRSNASWIQFSLDEFSVGPGEKKSVPYMVRVPNDATLCGSYWSAIMVQTITDTALNTENEGTAKINTALRFALQVVTNITNTGSGSVAFQNPKHHMNKDEFAFSVDIENTGETYFTLNSTAIVYSKTGGYVGTFTGNKKICYPGTSVKLTVNIPELEAGDYQVQFVADGGGDNIFGALYGLKI